MYFLFKLSFVSKKGSKFVWNPRFFVSDFILKLIKCFEVEGLDNFQRFHVMVFHSLSLSACVFHFVFHGMFYFSIWMYSIWKWKSSYDAMISSHSNISQCRYNIIAWITIVWCSVLIELFSLFQPPYYNNLMHLSYHLAHLTPFLAKIGESFICFYVIKMNRSP